MNLSDVQFPVSVGNSTYTVEINTLDSKVGVKIVVPV